MSDYPRPIDPNNPHGQPPPYLMPGYASIQSARQGSITVMSILAIIFGSLGLLCGGVGVISQLILLATGGRNPFAPTLPAMNNAAVTAYSTFAVLVMFALSAVLLAGGIAGLKLRPWARRAMIWWSIATIIWATTNLVITLLWINPAAAQYVRQVQLQTNPRAVTTMGSVLGPIQVISALIRWALTCALPVCFLILWRSPNVVAAFEGADVPGLPR